MFGVTKQEVKPKGTTISGFTTSDVKTSNPQLIHDPSSIYYLHPFEGPDMSLNLGIKVRPGDNYDVWAKQLSMVWRARTHWDLLMECYDIINGPRINQLKTKYHTLRQKGMYVVSFYNKFKAIWEELYGSKDATCGCICPAAALLKERFELGKNT
ncbi:hypothetical protein Leryth_017066 [Lithospermum erythrorhizon]|nr:hypothetical protein Leryth_017066 [Lithospermum erythrorhizon]